MTLEQLRIFVGVAEREHMTRAAEALNVTQSAASAAIAALEARYGVPLFHRVGRSIELSEAGRMFLAEARAVLGRASGAELALAEYAGLERGTLRLVASQTIAGYWLPRQLA
ncbi:MAG: LysR family transcriptional regulator, partial [Lysobacteraceae bacterium]